MDRDTARDAARAIAAAIAEDEGAAVMVREGGAAPISVSLELEPGERAFATRRSALVEESAAPDHAVFGGDLVVTDQRILVRGPVRSRSIPLDDIAEMAAVGAGVLQIELLAGRGIALQVDQPRRLRAEIQAARRIRRAAAP